MQNICKLGDFKNDLTFNIKNAFNNLENRLFVVVVKTELS